MEKETITAILLGIGLAASCGFRVFVPILIAALAARFGFLPITEGFSWITSSTAITCFSVATFVEIIAYYVPFVDNLLDTISSPLAIGAGTLLAATVIPLDNELFKWVMALIIGGGTASIVQGTTTVSRISSSTFTAGIGNPVVATGENLAAIGTPVLVIMWPLFIGGLVLLFVLILVRIIIRRKRKKRMRKV
ncbi:MAG: DUF4126 domain-containing protein [Draconibacterium sp.]|nr:DUF4126 domain-containing protein [Draconibacterium sp.]